MEKKNTGLIVLVIILSILVVGLGTIVIYDKALSKENSKNVINNNNENNSNNEINNENQNPIKNNNIKENSFELYASQILNNNNDYKQYTLEVGLDVGQKHYSTFWLTPNGDVYITRLEKPSVLLNNTSKYDNIFSKFENEKTEIPNFEIYGEKVKGYKLNIENVISMGIYNTGQDEYHIITFVKSDGSVFYIKTGDEQVFKDNDFNIIKSSLKNIVRFENIGIDAWEIYAIDINGNIFKGINY